MSAWDLFDVKLEGKGGRRTHAPRTAPHAPIYAALADAHGVDPVAGTRRERTPLEQVVETQEGRAIVRGRMADVIEWVQS